MIGIRYTPLINGIEPAWANLTVNIAGFPETAITKIDYSDNETIDNLYGAGQRPIARGYGKIEATATITLLRSAIENIREASSTGRLQDIAPFDIIVNFVPSQGGRVITHRIRNCQFKTDGLSVGKDDTSIETDLELVVSHIEWK